MNRIKRVCGVEGITPEILDAFQQGYISEIYNILE